MSEAVRITPEGLTLESGKKFRWAEVESITALKRSTDRDEALFLRFGLRGQEPVEIHEGMGGFTPLVDYLPGVLAGFPDREEWLHQVDDADLSDETLLYRAPESVVP